MKTKNYKYILIFITLTVLATIGLQIFWNIKNYKENKSQLINEVQTAFDNSIDYYYVEDSKNDFLAIIGNDNTVSKDDFFENLKLDTVFNKNDTLSQKKNREATTIALESIEYTPEPDDKIDKNVTKKISNSKFQLKKEFPKNTTDISSITILKGKKASDSISNIKSLVNKIIISMVKDSIEFTKLSKNLNKELLRKNIEINYRLQHYKADTIFASFPKAPNTQLQLAAFSSTTYLPKGQKLQISFSDPTILILKRSLTEIILSLLLSLSIIFCLLYLLRTINKQKKIDLIKNDLISNITHEFKTPITTISTAIEGIKNFNALDDKEKTNRYLEISGQQLKKLEIMVEKLLETASLDSNKLNLNKETIDIIPILKALIERHQMTSEKILNFIPLQIEIICSVDAFHFENVVSNLIDNAIKYGGDSISIEIKQTKNQMILAVKDNGIGIDKTQKEKIFDQFYRIPQGNIHDVKGFGIGLFYAKKIIEKHGGILELIPNSTETIFQITLHDVYKN